MFYGLSMGSDKWYFETAFHKYCILHNNFYINCQTIGVFNLPIIIFYNRYLAAYIGDLSLIPLLFIEK